MGNDFWIVVGWWGTLFLVGTVAYPLTKRLFANWFDHGYFFSKAVGMAVVTWIVYALGTVRLVPFSLESIVISLIVLFFGGLLIQALSGKQERVKKQNFTLHASRFTLLFLEELFFFLALLLWSWVKGHEPSIRGLEKFMDYGFMKSILESQYFPPPDMWYAGHSINYYYFGHMVVAVLTKLSGIDLAYAFNLMLATIFALTLTMSFSIGYQLMSNKREAISEKHENEKPRSYLSLISYRLSPFFAGFLTAFLVTLAGNMQTLYAFTKGYTGDNVKAFWQLLWPITEMWQKLPEGLNTYWYASATRFIPFTIHEFPSYSFVVSDVHGHVLSLPFTLLAIAMMIMMAIRDKQKAISKIESFPHFSLIASRLLLVFYGFLVGVLLMTNALDGPIYFGLLAVVLGVQSAKCKVQSWKIWGITISIVLITAALTSLPFLWHFKSFVEGLAINCPPGFLANTKVGPFLFEGVEKCQKSPVWMMALLWGFFLFCGGSFIISKCQSIMVSKDKGFKLDIELTQLEKLLVVFFLFSLALIIFPEFFYFKDIYPAHFRSNTMFKLGYQAFILFSIVSGYTIVDFIFKRHRNIDQNIKYQKSKILRTVFIIFLLPQLFLVSIYPIFSVRSYFNSLREYKGIYGLTWLQEEYPDDWKAMEWLNEQARKKAESFSFPLYASRFTLPVLVEADGDSYTDYNHFSAFTGMPTIVGWAVHEWLWRGGYDHVAPRREEVRQMYESEDPVLTGKILEKYNVRYIMVGTLERKKFTLLNEETLKTIATPVFQSGITVVYELPN